ncbi:von Willebrand factor A domain-containing protein 8 [Hondaea fermentalgiana]|uniref:von Willebrand factor A domain-containing protein 8 n=1 Tax=Hondaea fermentalgiana TaxID=2315210 RepID=A0A2R5G7G4_9STRA|nr:von Willebrand factor A domain-containing protein 8 [Hondaea fermentalgiana]|eukprot:GBG26940.1 von Willebrand factor A domain-containing protein 8 [Hondaea fermentalgiana]
MTITALGLRRRLRGGDGATRARRALSAWAGPCRVDKVSVDGRLYKGRVPNATKERFAPDQARLQHFTEERTRWQIPVQSSWQRAVDMACAAGGIHVLTESPIGVHSFWNLGPSAEAHGKTPSRSWLHLDEVLPYNANKPELAAFGSEELAMFLPNLRTLVFMSPNGGEVRVLNVPEMPNPFSTAHGAIDFGEEEAHSGGFFRHFFDHGSDKEKRRALKPRMLSGLAHQGLLVVDGGPLGTPCIDVLESMPDRSFPAMSRVHLPDGVLARNLVLCIRNLWLAEIEDLTADDKTPEAAWIARSEDASQPTGYAYNIQPIAKRKLSLQEALSSLDSLDFPGVAGAVMKSLETVDSDRAVAIHGARQHPTLAHPLAILQRVCEDPDDARTARLLTIPKMSTVDEEKDTSRGGQKMKNKTKGEKTKGQETNSLTSERVPDTPTQADVDFDLEQEVRLAQPLHHTSQVAMVLQAGSSRSDSSNKSSPKDGVVIRLVDEDRNLVKTITPVELRGTANENGNEDASLDWVTLAETNEGELVTMQRQGPHAVLRLYQVDHDAMTRDLAQWMEMHGLPSNATSATAVSIDNTGGGLLELSVQGGAGGLSANPPKVESPKHGKEDPENTPHVGGNTWAGGTGGSNTAGLGGRGGPYRLDKGHPVHQVTEAAKAEVDEATRQQARELNRKAFAERLQEIEMSEDEHDQYATFLSNVEQEISQLRVVLDAAEKKKQEREWLKNETFGELDDSKLVDCALGERLVYKRRGVRDPTPGEAQELPKRLLFLLDCSGSMYRFNSQDGRLRRECELAVMIMEALEPFADRYKYSIVGHSGESEAIQLVKFGNPPRTRKDRLRVCQHMIAHSQFCWSGDMTLEGTEAAIKAVDEEDADQKLVIVVSDANLRRYGIAASELGRRLIASPDVEAHALFIASFGEEAHRLQRELPPGRGHVLLDMGKLPSVFREILITNVVSP